MLVVLAGALGVIGVPGNALAGKCEVPDAGGTALLPPVGCEYLSPDEVFVIIDGLPPGATIELAPIQKNLICSGLGSCSQAIPPGVCEVPGGSLGGDVDCFQSDLQLEIRGTGVLAGFNRTITVQVDTEVHTGPRNAGNPVQTFPSEMFSLQGGIFGDPDFLSLVISAGSAFGLPSPGETTLTLLGNGKWEVDSFFDVSYEIDFVGAPGSLLDGMAGTTIGSLRMGSHVNPCDVVDNGTGTIDLPPAGCEYYNEFPDDIFEIIASLPPGTTIRLDAIHKNFSCSTPSGLCTIALPGGTCEGPGGSLGGNVECFQSEGALTIEGTGSLTGFTRSITIPLDTEIHTGPRNPGDPLQQFPSRMFRLQGEIFGDPDFCTLRIRAGDQNGLPSPGNTKLTDKGNGSFAVDSFFDITYEIDYVGCPGSMLEGFGGTESGTVRMQTGDPVPPPTGSTCLITHPTPGCSDAECEAAVCQIDPFCCSNSWDSLCVEEALAECSAFVPTMGRGGYFGLLLLIGLVGAAALGPLLYRARRREGS